MLTDCICCKTAAVMVGSNNRWDGKTVCDCEGVPAAIAAAERGCCCWAAAAERRNGFEDNAAEGRPVPCCAPCASAANIAAWAAASLVPLVSEPDAGSAAVSGREAPTTFGMALWRAFAAPNDIEAAPNEAAAPIPAAPNCKCIPPGAAAVVPPRCIAEAGRPCGGFGVVLKLWVVNNGTIYRNVMLSEPDRMSQDQCFQNR